MKRTSWCSVVRRILGKHSCFGSQRRNKSISSSNFHRNETVYRQALSFLDREQQVTAASVDPNTYVRLLRACTDGTSGKRIHAHVIANGLEQNPFVGDQIVQMYLKCGSLLDAEQMFHRLLQRGVVSWTVMISAYSHNGDYKMALQLFRQMQLDGVKPDKVAFLTILNAFGGPELLAEAKLIHLLLVESGMESDVVLGNALVSMYGKCQSIEDARRMFERIRERDVVSWNSIVAAYAQLGHPQEAFHMFRQMQLEGVKPEKITCVSVLNACNCPPALVEGKVIHSCINEGGYHSEIIVGNAMLNMYAKCGSPEDAQTTFDGMDERDVVSWTAIIAAYAQQSQREQALQLFQQMQLEGVALDKVTFVTLLDACSCPEDLAEGKMIHGRVSESGFESDIVVGNSLVNMYGKCGSLEDARSMFDRMSRRDVISWNAMLGAYAQHGLSKECLELFFQMKKVKPDRLTFVTVVNVCANLPALAEGKRIHAQILEQGLEADPVLGTSLVNLYGKCGCLEDARKLFDRMPEKVLISWNCMISAYVQYEQHKEALKLYKEMDLSLQPPDKITFIAVLNACAGVASLREGKAVHEHIVRALLESDVMVATALIDMYAKCGSLQQALGVFSTMPEQNVISWNSMIAAYAQHGKSKEAVRLFRRMLQENVKPDKVTFINTLCACSHGGLIEEASQYFTSMVADYELTPSTEHYGCMIDLLGRLGWLEEAEQFIAKMPMQANAVMWTAFLGACRIHGDVKRAKRIAEHVLTLGPEHTAAYVMLSSIYAEAGRWEEAARLRKMGLKKEPGCSSIEVMDKMHDFLASDTSHPQTKEIYAELERINTMLRQAGYVADTKLTLHDVEEEVKGSLISYHSERLAIAFGIISTPEETPIRIIKNLRVCWDCHAAIKFISKIVKREIVVRDTHRLHQFEGGVCSCGDYW